MAKKKSTRTKRPNRRLRSNKIKTLSTRRRVEKPTGFYTVKNTKRVFVKINRTVQAPSAPSPKKHILKSKIVSQTIKPYICAKRKIRKEVMHALNKTGQAGQKKPNWTDQSSIKCK